MKHLDILYQISAREIKSKYKGSILGFLWPVLTPLILLAIYTIIFSQVFEIKWNVSGSDNTSFAIFLFSGLIILNFFNDVISKAPSLIPNQSSLVKKVSFPLEILPLSIVLVALFQLLINILILLLFIFYSNNIQFSIFFLPLILISLILLTTGFSFFLSALGVYIRDLINIMPIICTLLLFLSPIFYPLSAVPEKLQFFITLNPLSLIIEQTREVIILGYYPSLLDVFLYFIFSSIIFILGYMFFIKTKKGFADVI
jgi:lipopolysaccharide transport system permease protein